MQPKHSAIVAGLTLALSFGAVSAPAPAAAEEPTPGVASDATDIDKGLYTQQSFSGVLRSVQGVSFVNVTPEMKYFTKYESHGNYNQGFSYGDGYNALGYYQFDRRWSLIPFMKQVYNYSPEKYSMLKDAIDRGSEISNTSNAMYENGQLTELGHIAQDAFQGAYNTDPVEFSALQDAYAYNSYYAVTEAWLKSGLGINISGRADCVKGMVWSITNMCGTGGCRDFFRWANLSNDMSDREFVTALSNSVVNNVATKFSSQPQYHEGWKNRYRNELKDCLVFIAEDEAAAATPEQPEPAPTPDSNDDPSDDGSDDRMDAPSTDADGNGSAGGATNDGSTSNGSDLNGSAAGDSSSSSAGNTDSDASGSTDADTSHSSTGSSDSSVDTGSNNGSGSDATPDSDASKDDSNKAPDAPVASPDKKPSFSEQLGSTLGSSLMAGVNNGSAQNKDNSDQASTEKTEVAKGDSKDKASEKTESDKGSSSEEKDDKSTQKKDEDKKSESEEKDKSKTEDGKKQPEDDDKSGADNQVQEQNDSKTVTTTTTTTTTTKSSGGNMPKTGDLIVMASLASASLATLGATSIVSGKHILDQQKKASGEDGSEE
ncbi:MAG: hypothetical protein U0J89_03210 [Collinsella sp.]|nr:hypothetical protein [Collinsella sp.]